MKAYMGVNESPCSILGCPGGELHEVFLEWHSYQEAKRILADVEPIQGHQPNYYYEGYDIFIDGHEALVESLKNFIKTLDKMGH